MANYKRKYNFEIGVNFNQTGFETLKKQLDYIATMNLSKLGKNIDIKEYQAAADAARKLSMALQAAYNKKLNTANILEFRKAAKDLNVDLNKINATFGNIGPNGQRVVQLLTNEMTNFHVQVKESHQLLNKLGRTLANTIKWNLSTSIVNSFTQSIQQAWGFTKNLQQSLTDIRIVTGKSAEEMRRFAIEANNGAKALGRTTTDYTRASLIYAQQGLNDREIKERTAITLKTANVTGQATETVSEELTAV